MPTSSVAPQKWWKEATGYQIWPASFQDSNGDGYGDIWGIISRLDHLKYLGVDFIWISPVYDSPQHDMGYDIRDYENVWAKYGTMEDMDVLIKEVKARGMRLVMDLVVNHTSNEHRWFLESRKSRTNPYSDWYIWQDPKYKDGQRCPPNNWRAAFGGSVWTYGPERDQYYLHLCLPEQPDLNWLNDDTRRGIYESAIEFWLKKGIDGFRVDVVNFYWKDPTFPDSKVLNPNEEFQPMEAQHIMNGPKMHDWLREERTEVLDKYGEDIVMIGELPGTGREEVLKYTSPQSRELDMIFDFDIFQAGNDWNARIHEYRRYKLPELKDPVVKTQNFLSETDSWTTTFLENHDNSRSISRFGPGEGDYCRAAAKMLAMFTTALSGTLFIYQGQEIGMTNVPSSWKREDFRDRAILRYLEEMDEQYPNDEPMKQKILEAARRWSRDNARTPVQWSAEQNAGFCTAVEPWIPVNHNYEQINVASQVGDSDSVLEFWRQMLKIRKLHRDTLIHGSFELVDRENEQTFSFYKRSNDGHDTIFASFNFSENEVDLVMPGHTGKDVELIISSTGIGQHLERLQAWEGRLYKLKSTIGP